MPSRPADRGGAPADPALADPALRAALAAGLDAPVSPRAARLAAHVARAFGRAAGAVGPNGSHAHRADARPESAHDFFVVVAGYRDAYRAAAAAGAAYRPGVAAALNRVLPPNVVAVSDAGAAPPLHAKCAVLSLADFRRACSPRARDHFVRGRLFQQAQLAWARDAAARAAVVEAVVEARAGSFAWGRPLLPPRFDAEGYCRALLAASFAAEIRPEGGDRVAALVEAQRATLVPVYGALLGALAASGVLADVGGGAYADPRPPGPAAARRRAAYFRRSKRRATARWVKYVALYDDWLDYALQKVARRSGAAVELTPRERRWPLIFLWPKAIRYLRSRPQKAPRAGAPLPPTRP